MKQRAEKMVRSPATPNTDSRPAEPGRRIRASRRGGRPIRVDEKLAQAGRITRRAASEGIARSGMQLTDIAQLRTQHHPPAGSLQARSQGLAVEDGAAGVARPAKHRCAVGGRRISCGRRHTGYQGSPCSGSSIARLGCPSKVGAGKIVVPGKTLGGKTSPVEGVPHVGLGECRFDETPASPDLALRATLAAQ